MPEVPRLEQSYWKSRKSWKSFVLSSKVVQELIYMVFIRFLHPEQHRNNVPDRFGYRPDLSYFSKHINMFVSRWIWRCRNWASKPWILLRLFQLVFYYRSKQNSTTYQKEIWVKNLKSEEIWVKETLMCSNQKVRDIYSMQMIHLLQPDDSSLQPEAPRIKILLNTRISFKKGWLPIEILETPRKTHMFDICCDFRAPLYYPASIWT